MYIYAWIHISRNSGYKRPYITERERERNGGKGRTQKLQMPRKWVLKDTLLEHMCLLYLSLWWSIQLPSPILSRRKEATSIHFSNTMLTICLTYFVSFIAGNLGCSNSSRRSHGVSWCYLCSSWALKVNLGSLIRVWADIKQSINTVHENNYREFYLEGWRQMWYTAKLSP